MDKAFLKKLFPGLEEELYDELVEHGESREIRAGDVLLRMGQTIRSTMLILEGSIKLYREDDEGQEFYIYSLNPGQACSLSLICAIKQETSGVLARAMTDAVVLSVPLEYMDRWMKKYSSWYKFVITSYRDRFEELLRTIDAIAFNNLDERLEFYLKRQAEVYGNHLKLTHQEIANDLNSSREVVSRLLKKMETRKFLVLHRNSIEWLGTVAATV